MRFATVHIDRFGGRSNLHLDHLSEGLNVIHGPNGSGKSTILQFVRWMLFGQTDPRIGRSFRPPSGIAEGSLTIWDAGLGGGTIHRVQEDELPARTEWQSAGDPHWRTQLPPGVAITADEFDQLFGLSFDRPYRIEDLMQTVGRRGIQLWPFADESSRLHHLRQQYDDLARELEWAESRAAQWQTSRRRQAEIAAEIDALEQIERRHREQIVETQQGLRQELAQLKQLRLDLSAELEAAEEALAQQRQQLDHNLQHAIQLARRIIADRAATADQLAQQRRHGQETLRNISDRLDRLQVELARSHSTGEPLDGRHAVKLQALLRLLAAGSPQDACHAALALNENVQRSGWMQGAATSRQAADALLHDLKQINALLASQEQRQRQRDMQIQVEHLRRIERALVEWIDQLGLQEAELRDSLRLSRPDANQAGSNGHSSLVGGPGNDRLTIDAHSLSDDLARHPLVRMQLEAYVLRRDELDRQWRDVDRQVGHIEAELARGAHPPLTSAEAARLAALRQELASFQHHGDPALRVESLRRQLDELRQEIRRIEQHREPSAIVRQASQWVRQVTAGQFSEIRMTPSGLVVASTTGKLESLDQISSGVRDQVYLCLALAVVQAYRKQDLFAPLVIGDLFANLDLGATLATARLLDSFSRDHHQQVIVLTRHDHVLQTFRSLGAQAYSLRARQAAESLEPIAALRSSHGSNGDWSGRSMAVGTQEYSDRPAAAGWEGRRERRSFQWVTRWEEGRPRRGDAGEPAPRTADSSGPSATAFPAASSLLGSVAELDRIQPEDSIRRFRGISPDQCRLLQSIGVSTVRDLLALAPSYADEKLRREGITGGLLRQWQCEAALQCHVGLSFSEARLLIGCGIDDADTLASLEPEAVARRIDALMADGSASHDYSNARSIGRDRITRWIESARLWRAGNATPPPPRLFRQGSSPDASVQDDAGHFFAADERLQFYLELHDEIVDAPAIGPKTAQRLREQGVETVGELLRANPAKLASQLDHPRITAQTVQEWQVLAALVCRIPNLRSQDAQVLAACGIERPEALAEASPEALHELVDRLCESQQGRRILRGGRRPTHQDVDAWIRWARSARRLQAA